jgi:hypothetical protein
VEDVEALAGDRVAVGDGDAPARLDVEMRDENPLRMVERVDEDDGPLAADRILEHLPAPAHIENVAG